MPPPYNLDDESLRLNQLASNIHTVADARRFIDAIVELFADDLPPTWTTESFRSRLAQAEYLAVTDPHKCIPEQHVATAWNNYVSTIGAPEDSQVTAAEIHCLRDSEFTYGRVMWDRGYRNFWLLPSIFAVQPDGTLAPDCRVLESVRIFYDLVRFPQNLRAVRAAVAKGIVTPELMKQSQQKASSSSPGRAYLSAGKGEKNYVESAAVQYIREHGMAAFSDIIETMLNTVLNG